VTKGLGALDRAGIFGHESTVEVPAHSRTRMVPGCSP
jgi:hypothetical protein